MHENLYKEKISYEQIVSLDNVFIKSAFKTLPVPLEKIIQDFDKVIFLLRRNKTEQVESAILLTRENDFLNYSKKKYWIDSIDDVDRQTFGDRYDFLNETLTKCAIDNNKKIFYYEDLYYGSFNEFFAEMELPFNQEAFDEYLDITHRYKENVVSNKKIKSII
jgi:hypothetical protein